MTSSSYRIWQQLGPKDVTWNNKSPSRLKITMSPTRTPWPLAKFCQPRVSLRPSIFTSQVLSEASDVSFTTALSSFVVPLTWFEKKVMGMFWNERNSETENKKTDACIFRERERERDYEVALKTGKKRLEKMWIDRWGSWSICHWRWSFFFFNFGIFFFPQVLLCLDFKDKIFGYQDKPLLDMSKRHVSVSDSRIGEQADTFSTDDKFYLLKKLFFMFSIKKKT